jgi:hypothetical protein
LIIIIVIAWRQGREGSGQFSVKSGLLGRIDVDKGSVRRLNHGSAAGRTPGRVWRNMDRLILALDTVQGIKYSRLTIAATRVLSRAEVPATCVAWSIFWF